MVFLYIPTLLQMPTQVAGLDILYCSPLNTGSNFDSGVLLSCPNGRGAVN
jgi:hypothetical protein